MLLASLILAFHLEVVRPPNEAAGTYRCLTMHVGRHVKRCPLPPLVLADDGTYTLWKETGTYSKINNFILLSGGPTRRGPGLLQKNRMLMFEFYNRGRRCKVMFQRTDILKEGYRYARRTR